MHSQTDRRVKRDEMLQQASLKNKQIFIRLAQKGDLDEAGPINQETMTKTFPFSKVKVQFDEEDTKRIAWNKKLPTPEKRFEGKEEDCQDRRSLSEESDDQSSEQSEQILQASYNKRVQEILQKEPLRSRVANLLQPSEQLSIGFEHQQLLKRMELIDRTIDFLAQHRGTKVFFFQTLKKNIAETGNTYITYQNFQQLTFLMADCYQIEWKFNEKIRRMDLRISLPSISLSNSYNSSEYLTFRKGLMRKKIVEFLQNQQKQMLREQQTDIFGQAQQQRRRWNPKFNPNQIKIPLKPLPARPNALNNFGQQSQNPGLQSGAAINILFSSRKDNYNPKKLSKSSMQDMIFSNNSCRRNITQTLLQSIKQKQKELKKAKSQEDEATCKLDKKTLVKICEEIFLIYMSKGISNMFKTTLIDMLKTRVRILNDRYSQYVDRVLNIHQLGFLKQVQSSQKLKVIQINKQKYKSAKQYIQNNQ